MLIVGATPDAANELARKVAKDKGAAFGWHPLTLPQLAFAVAAPILAARGLTPLSRIGAGALVARLVHRMNVEGRLSHYRSAVTTPATLNRPAKALVAAKKPRAASLRSGGRHHLVSVGGIIPLRRATSSRFGGRHRQESARLALLDHIGRRKDRLRRSVLATVRHSRRHLKFLARRERARALAVNRKVDPPSMR